MSLLRRVCLPVIGLACLGPAVAQASGSLTAADIMSQFNLVTTGNVTTSSDIEGAAVVGGTLSGNTTLLSNASSSAAQNVVDVYGNVSNANANVNGSGSVSVHGTVHNSTINMNGEDTLNYGGSLAGSHVNFNGAAWNKSVPSQPLSTYTAPLTSLSNSLAGLTQNSSLVLSNNTLTFDAVANNHGMAVFDLSASTLKSDLSSTSNMSFALGSGVKGVVVNVTGSTFSQPSNVNWNQSPQQKVLFNFTSATSVTVGNWQSSILAPKATVSISNGALNGTLFAANFAGGGELHNHTYTGALDLPEPSSFAVLGAGLAGLIAARRRRRR